MSEDAPKPKLTRESLRVFTSDLPPRIPQSEKNYRYRLTLAGPRYGAEPQEWTPYQNGKAEFESFRDTQALIQRVELMKIHLVAEGVDDYKIEENKNSTDLYFFTQKDINIAKMAFLEKDVEYPVIFPPERPDMSLEEAAQHMMSFQASFNEAVLKNVHFTLIAKTREIRAVANGRRAFVDLLGNNQPLDLQQFL